MGVSAKILDRIAKPIKGFLAVGTPFLMIKVITETRPFIGIPELFTGSGKYKQLFFIKRVQASKIFSLKFITEDFGPDKKIFFGFSYLMVRRKAAAGDNAVHMYMVIQFLVPGMQYLDDPGCCTEPLFISGKL